jgi:hypothetical protein
MITESSVRESAMITIVCGKLIQKGESITANKLFRNLYSMYHRKINIYGTIYKVTHVLF